MHGCRICNIDVCELCHSRLYAPTAGGEDDEADSDDMCAPGLHSRYDDEDAYDDADDVEDEQTAARSKQTAQPALLGALRPP